MTTDLLDFLPGGAADLADREADPLVCLRDAVPTALQAVVHLSWWKPVDDAKTSANDLFAYRVCRAGLRYQRTAEWWAQGAIAWERKPKHLYTWDQLSAAIGDDPRRPAVIAWAESLTVADKWKDLYRPHQMWVKPEMWHPSYITGDHERPGWADRLAAWRTVRAILTDAIGGPA